MQSDFTARRDEEFRQELKFVIGESELSCFWNWVHNSKAFFRKAFPDRIVNNIYFDSFDLEGAEANIAGVSRRYKSRLRWYGSKSQVEKLIFEYKIKKAKLGKKHSFEVGITDLADLKIRDLRDHLFKRASSVESQLSGYFLNPVIRNQYERAYFVSANERIRLTFDRNQVYCRAASQQELINYKYSYSFPYYIAELKAEESETRYLAQIVQDIPLRASKMSKYLVAVTSVFGIPYY